MARPENAPFAPGGDPCPAPPATIAQALAWGAEQLGSVADRPHLEAERLLAAALRSDRPALLAHPERELKSAPVEVYARAIRRRAAGMPLPYILGHVAFRDLDFIVTPDVLIPRPETEHLVERALARLATHPGHTVIDVGTGSGCIAISLALALPDTRVYAADISAAALEVARANALRHDVAQRISWIQADLLSPFAPTFDLVVSNPPYIADAEWMALAPSVRQEPRLALTGGPDGLLIIGRLLSQAAERLRSGGCILMEIGASQGNAAQALARAAFEERSIALLVHPDLAGHDRVLELCCQEAA